MSSRGTSTKLIISRNTWKWDQLLFYLWAYGYEELIWPCTAWCLGLNWCQQLYPPQLLHLSTKEHILFHNNYLNRDSSTFRLCQHCLCLLPRTSKQQNIFGEKLGGTRWIQAKQQVLSCVHIHSQLALQEKAGIWIPSSMVHFHCLVDSGSVGFHVGSTVAARSLCLPETVWPLYPQPNFSVCFKGFLISSLEHCKSAELLKISAHTHLKCSF